MHFHNFEIDIQITKDRKLCKLVTLVLCVACTVLLLVIVILIAALSLPAAF